MKLTRKAFTLVELIIVIAIIAVLAVSAFMVLTKWLGKSRDSRRLGDVGAIERALSTWMSDYDDNGQGTLTAATTNNVVSGALVVSKSDYFDDYFTALKAAGFDVLQKVVSDPNGDDEYFVTIADTKKHFAIAATLEDDGDYKAALRTNYQAGAALTISGSSWTGDSIMVKTGSTDVITDESETNYPYSLTD